MRKKKGKLWRLDVIIMCGCLGLEDDWIAGSHLCHLSASPPHPHPPVTQQKPGAGRTGQGGFNKFTTNNDFMWFLRLSLF